MHLRIICYYKYAVAGSIIMGLLYSKYGQPIPVAQCKIIVHIGLTWGFGNDI